MKKKLKLKWFICLVVSVIFLSGYFVKNPLYSSTNGDQCSPDISLLGYTEYGDKLYSGIDRGNHIYCITVLVDLDDVFSKIHEIEKGDKVGVIKVKGITTSYRLKENLNFVSPSKKQNCLILRMPKEHLDLTFCKVDSEKIRILFNYNGKGRNVLAWKYKRV